jgi:hypothetical protein
MAGVALEQSRLAGTVIYAVDPQTREFLAELVETMMSPLAGVPGS